MKILRARTTAFSHPSPDCLVELETDEGLTGLAVGPVEACTEAENLGNEFLVDQDPRAVVALWQNLHDNALLDIALWDLKAKYNGEPLWRALGGSRPQANAYISLDDDSPDIGELAGQYGFREAKLSLGPDMASNVRRLSVIRQALLQHAAYPVLMINAGDHWTADEAIENIHELEKSFDLTWVECEVWTPEERRQISDNVFAAVCSRGFPTADQRAADIVQLDLLATGITGSMQIADAAYGFELPVTLRASPGNIGAHLAAALPNFMNMEVRDLTPSDVSIEDGRAVVGEAKPE